MSFYSDFAEHYEAVFPLREPVLARLRALLPPGRARVLDLGCGPGAYCGRLAAAGHEATGIDLDPAMIAAARRAWPAARFATRDLLDCDAEPGPFDLVYCIGNVLAHVPAAALPALLAKVHAALRPGGAWLLQTVNWDGVLAAGRAGHRFPDRVLPGGVVFSREYRDITPQRLRFLTRLAANGRELFAGEAELHPVTAADYRLLHGQAGFVAAAHWGDFDGAPFCAADAAGSVFVWRRP